MAGETSPEANEAAVHASLNGADIAEVFFGAAENNEFNPPNTQANDIALENAISDAGGNTAVSRALAFRLYISHFLSTWNSRLFEAGVIYFLAAIFPGTLLRVSIYSLLRNVVAIALTAPVGSLIDRGNRLIVVRTSIIGQRVPVAASCAVFSVMLRMPLLGASAKNGLFATTVILGCLEKLAAGVNLVSVERDWVVVITQGSERDRIKMNARLRRIDLFCKLVGPLAIGLIASASTQVAVYTTLGMNVLSVLVEYKCIEKVFHMVPTLRRIPLDQIPAVNTELPNTEAPAIEAVEPNRSPTTWHSIRQSAAYLFMVPSLRLYFRHPVVIPSFALSLLYLTVLAFSGQMLTYLLASHITVWQLSIIRAVSTVCELSATWIQPWLAKHIKVLRAGLWSISWQMIWLTAGLVWFFNYFFDGVSPTNVMPAAGLAAAVSLSRVGLWGYDLSAQNIVQDEVQDGARGTFSTVETAFQNLFDSLSWVLTIIWSDPSSFQWPVFISAMAVYAAGGLYAYFMRGRRGHLLHQPSCFNPKEGRISDRSNTPAGRSNT